LTSQHTEHTIAATTHGRFLVRNGPPERLLIGFHGYGENADIHLDDLTAIPGTDQWTVVAIQALNRFYIHRTDETAGCWMTRQNRELAIADNIAYVRSVVATFPQPKTLVFAGFSQGVAMAYRAAASIRCDGVIVLGGDLPPDVTANLPPVLVGRGTKDDWYTQEKLEKDLKFLQSITQVTSCVFEGRHEWTDEFRAAASRFLPPWSIASRS
jgi:predicted esterase